jgi:hypothetical protein
MAFMNRVPSIMIEYMPKCADFMASIEMEKYNLKTSDLTLDKFVKLFNDLKLNKDHVIKKSESKILKYKEVQINAAAKLISL